ncbi:MAG: glycosyltransferase family 2 protein [Patescibacteria group bacterium]|jgi:GT2 family glycosyltransferase
MNEPKLSIIILNWNTAKLLRDCLESLESTINSKQLTVEVIVVDNGSTDNSVQEVKSLKFKNFKLKIIENGENLGFSKGNNIGIKAATGQYIMLLNSDTIVQKDALLQLTAFLDTHSEVDIIGPKLLNSDGTLQANCGRFPDLWVSAIMLFVEHLGANRFVRWSPKKSEFVDWLMGAAFIARREVFDKIGGLDERIFMYMEEVEWFYRAQKAGFKAYFLKEVEIIHLGRGSSKSGKKEPILNIYRGLLHYYREHGNPVSLTILRFMLKIKAAIALTIGYLKKDNYLKETYAEAIKIN